jgi:hypothetical protein
VRPISDIPQDQGAQPRARIAQVAPKLGAEASRYDNGLLVAVRVAMPPLHQMDAQRRQAGHQPLRHQHLDPAEDVERRRARPRGVGQVGHDVQLRDGAAEVGVAQDPLEDGEGGVLGAEDEARVEQGEDDVVQVAVSEG